ncbi:MAG TPA: SH3 domain-containing protein [Feifaniaceae bacterium]|nr:SH3 domain-containing protein [Feifaniaceae bacterium]
MKTTRKGLRILALTLCMAVLLGLAAPALAANIYTYGKVIADDTKVYATADRTTVIGTFAKNDIVGIEYQVSDKGVYVVRTSATGTATGYIEKTAVTLTNAAALSEMKAASGTAAATTGIIYNVSSFANMRDKASTSGSNVIAKPAKGATVTILGESGSFYQVSYDGKTGYISKTYVNVGGSSGSGATTGTTGTGTTGVIYNVNSNVNMRSLASTSSSSKIIAKPAKGATVTILGESGSFYQVSYSGKTGYIDKRYVQVSGATGSTGSTTAGTGKIKVTPYQSDIPAAIKSKLDAAQKKNSDVIGYISINGTNISHPILFKKGDVHYYATHDAVKKSSSSGAIYAFYGDMVRNNTITGHNMRQSGTMFHQLHYLQEKTLGFSTHQTTDSGAKKGSLSSIPSLTVAANRLWNVTLFGYNQWQVWAMYETQATEPTSTLTYNINPLSSSTPAQVKAWVDYQKGRSEYNFNTDVSTDDIFLTVYTCGNNYDYADAQSRIYFFLKAVK